MSDTRAIVPNTGLNWSRRKPSIVGGSTPRARPDTTSPCMSPSASSSSVSASTSSSAQTLAPPPVATARSAPVSPATHRSASLSLSSPPPLPPLPKATASVEFPRILKSASYRPLKAVEVVAPRKALPYLEIGPDAIRCPACAMDVAVVPMGYWDERHEIVLICGNVFVDKTRDPGYRVCGTKWVPSEPTALCTCRAPLTIETRGKQYVYVCPDCHHVSQTSRQGDTLAMTLRNTTVNTL